MLKSKRLWLVIALVVLALVIVLVIVNPFRSEASKAESFFGRKSMEQRTPPETMFSGEEHLESTPEMLKELHELYMLGSLDDFKLYSNGLDVQGEFYFSKDATASELEQAIRFGYEKLHLAVPNMIIDSEFSGWMLNSTGILDSDKSYYDNTELLLYIGDELVLYHRYEAMSLVQKYENALINISARIDADINEHMNKFAISVYEGKQASAQRSMMGRAILLQISGENMLTTGEYERLVAMLENDTYIHESAPGRSHIVLLLIDGEGQAYSEDVFEYKDDKWVKADVDWMGLKPY